RTRLVRPAATDGASGRDPARRPRDVAASTPVDGERPDPAAPLTSDDLSRQGRQRQVLLEGQQPAQSAILVVGLDDAKPLNPKLLHFLTQAPVLGAHVLPVEIGRPETKGGAARLREPGLDGGGDDREDVAGHLAVPAHLEREEQQASRHQGAEQYDLPNLHLPTPREKARTCLSG